jgi:hypothetical protein
MQAVAFHITLDSLHHAYTNECLKYCNSHNVSEEILFTAHNLTSTTRIGSTTCLPHTNPSKLLDQFSHNYQGKTQKYRFPVASNIYL